MSLLSIYLIAQANLTGVQYTLEIKGNPADKRLMISNLMSDMIIKAHDKNVLIMEAEGYEGLPEKAKGLKPLSATGVDNTNIGLHYKMEGNEIMVQGASRESRDANYTFYVPKSMNLSIDGKGWENGDITVEGMAGEVEAKSNIGDLIIKEVTGPLVLWTLSSDIEIEYAGLSQAGPHSITSTSGEIDIALPANTKGNFDLKSVSGEIYTDMDFDFPEKEGMKRVAAGISAKGTLNGGGVEFSVKSISGNVYIRKN